MTKHNRIFIAIIASIIVLFFTLVLNFIFWSSIGLSFFAFFLVKFYLEIGENIDFRDLIIFIPILQWIVGPWLSYTFVTDKVYYYMAVEEDVYMAFAVPAVLMFAIGLYIPIGNSKIHLNEVLRRIKNFVDNNKNIDFLFLFLGLVFYFVEDFLPIQVRFFAFLLGNLRYVGLLFLFLNNRKAKKILFNFFLLFTLFMSLKDAMFHLMILWFGFLFFIIAFIQKISVVRKSLIITLLFIGMILIQTVKYEYRKLVWSSSNKNITYVVETFGSLVSEKIQTEDAITNESNLNNMISRINQGWIIAKIMYYVPAFEPYAKGETIENAITASLLPRFLNPNKVVSGGREYFMRFTGRNLEEGTSMNISVLGEAYANYGKNGIWFMFVFGLFLNLSYKFILRQIIKTPTLLFFLPIIYLQVIKAETDFATVLNHFVKSSVFVWMVYFGLRKFLKIKI